MGKLVVTEFITLDGVIEAQPRPWHTPAPVEEFVRLVSSIPIPQSPPNPPLGEAA